MRLLTRLYGSSHKGMLTQHFERLQLKEESFKPITAASKQGNDVIYHLIQEVEPSLIRRE